MLQDVRHTLKAPWQPAPGHAQVELAVRRTGKNAVRATLRADGSELGAIGDIPKTWPTHGTTAGLNCGRDAGAPVSFSYQAPFAFTGGGLRVKVKLTTDSESEPGAAYAAVMKEQ